MPALAQLNSCDRASYLEALEPLFEGSPWIAAETISRRPFKDEAHLYGELCAVLRRASPDRQLGVIRAHPDLAGHLTRIGRLTSVSAREQSCAGLDDLDDAELAEFQTLNAAYWARFGCPFVICTRLNGKEAILQAMRSRLANSYETEQAASIAEIEKIVKLRLTDLLAS
jgi:OHCU decarboxylase